MSAGKIKFNFSEFSGALGDAGTFVPIFISLVAVNGLNPTIILLFFGATYILCGSYYRVPIPVQPLKAFAAIAIAGGLSVSIISAGGILIGVILLILAITKLSDFLEKIFTKVIIRGIQLGVGLVLIKSAWTLIINPGINNQTNGAVNALPINLIIIVVGIALMLIFLLNKRFPASVSILIFGIAMSIVSGQKDAVALPLFVSQKIGLSVPAIDDFVKAFFMLVIPQIPLTLGNAVVATKDVAGRYFGEKAIRVNERSLSFSMGISNVAAGFIGGIPVCHGSGGLTAHYSFGARTGGSVIIMGLLCLTAGLVFGKSADKFFALIPHSILGIMLFYVGVKHALLIRDLKDKKELLIVFGMGAISLFTQNLTIACVAGIIILYLLKIRALKFKTNKQEEVIDREKKKYL